MFFTSRLPSYGVIKIAIIFIDGSEGAGKTTLIKSLLTSEALSEFNLNYVKCPIGESRQTNMEQIVDKLFYRHQMSDAFIQDIFMIGNTFSLIQEHAYKPGLHIFDRGILSNVVYQLRQNMSTGELYPEEYWMPRVASLTQALRMAFPDLFIEGANMYGIGSILLIADPEVLRKRILSRDESETNVVNRKHLVHLKSINDMFLSIHTSNDTTSIFLKSQLITTTHMTQKQVHIEAIAYISDFVQKLGHSVPYTKKTYIEPLTISNKYDLGVLEAMCVQLQCGTVDDDAYGIYTRLKNIFSDDDTISIPDERTIRVAYATYFILFAATNKCDKVVIKNIIDCVLQNKLLIDIIERLNMANISKEIELYILLKNNIAAYYKLLTGDKLLFD